jgi:hypothetical protein
MPHLRQNRQRRSISSHRTVPHALGCKPPTPCHDHMPPFRAAGHTNGRLISNRYLTLVNCCQNCICSDVAHLVLAGEHLAPAERPYAWLGGQKASGAVAALTTWLGDIAPPTLARLQVSPGLCTQGKG